MPLIKGKSTTPAYMVVMLELPIEKNIYYSAKRIARVETSCYNPRRRPKVWTMGLFFVKAVIPQLWKPLLINGRCLFISLECLERRHSGRQNRCFQGVRLSTRVWKMC